MIRLGIALLRRFTTGTTLRGRHRLVDLLAPRLHSGEETIDFGEMRVRIDHSLSVCRYMYYGLYEEHLVHWISRNICAGDVVIEPGANRGYITAHLLRAVTPGGLVLALEPSDRCLGILQRDNDLERVPALKLLRAALGDRVTQATFCESERIFSHGYGCLAQVARPADAIDYQVDVLTVDQLMETYDINRIRFLKLDVEGSESAALRGAARALARRAIDFVMVETTILSSDAEATRLSHEAIRLLTDAGYSAHRMTPTGSLVPMQLDQITEVRTDVMWTRLHESNRRPSGDQHPMTGTRRSGWA